MIAGLLKRENRLFVKGQPVQGVWAIAAVLLLGACEKPTAPPSTPASPPPPSLVDSVAGESEDLPTLFKDGLIFLNPKTNSGIELLLLADTGGGTFLHESAAFELGISGDSPGEALEISWRPGRSMPAPASGRWPVLAAGESLPHTVSWSGIAGADWFANGIWFIDYPNKRLRRLFQNEVPIGSEGSLPLTFQEDEKGQRTSHFATLEVEVDGKTWPVLLDTGAQSLLPEKALRRIGDRQGALRGTSFMAGRIFDQWRRQHPDWSYIPAADTLAPESGMIQVPRMSLGSLEVGPVWWSRRPDENFDTSLSRWTEPAVVGALGASALDSLRLVLSYPDRRLWVEPSSGP